MPAQYGRDIIRIAAEMMEEASQAKTETSQAKTEVIQAYKELAQANQKLGNAEVAIEVAKTRTMDKMRDLNMVHARGILEAAAIFEAPLYGLESSNRIPLWTKILETRPDLASCLSGLPGWSKGQAPKQIDALYTNLNSRMHQNAGPQASDAMGGIVLQLGASGSGLSEVQSRALACICESFYIRYSIRAADERTLKTYAGISDSDNHKAWEQKVATRNVELAKACTKAATSTAADRQAAPASDPPKKKAKKTKR